MPALELHRSLPSTNARLLERARAGAAPLTTIVAGMQTEGRGRVRRRWHSPEGAGLWMSVLLSSDEAEASHVLPLAVGSALAGVLEAHSRTPVGLKWPNDILIGDRKVAGILCEAVSERRGGIVVGLGVNLRRPPSGYPAELAPAAAFLEEEAGSPVEEPALTGALIEALRRTAQPAPVRLTGDLREAWERRDRLRGRWVRVDTGREGRAVGVADDGSLELEADGRTIWVRAGSVRAVDDGIGTALHGPVPGKVDSAGGREAE